MTTTKKPVLDDEHPEILEEARWWINVSKTRTRLEKDTATMEARVQLENTPDVINALTSSFPQSSVAPTGAVDMKAIMALATSGVFFFKICSKENSNISFLSDISPGGSSAASEPEPKASGRRTSKAKGKAKAKAKGGQPLESKTQEDIASDACALDLLAIFTLILRRPSG